MSDETHIQFSDSTVNTSMGCGVNCELKPTPRQARDWADTFLRKEFPRATPDEIAEILDNVIGDHNASEIFNLRACLVSEACAALGVTPFAPAAVKAMTGRLKDHFDLIYICFAHRLHLRHGIDITKPDKKINSGYAPQFEQVTLFPGRMAEVACLSDLFGTMRKDKPWLDYLPRVIFISDMGDSLSEGIDFDYLKTEIIDVVGTARGSQHIWLWITKEPRRMAEFGNWLQRQNVKWPDCLVAMTTVTAQDKTARIAQLRKVPARFKGLSIEPLFGEITLPLDGIDWLFVGGQSGDGGVRPFDLAWLDSLREQCAAFGTSLFVKQLGGRPVWNGRQLKLKHKHGGDWSEWPGKFRIRDMPSGFRSLRLEADNLAHETPATAISVTHP